MGFGDLFIAATSAAFWPLQRPWQQFCGAALVAVLGLGFDLLFFAVDTLPATVPVALALALVELRGRRASGVAG